MMGWGGVERTVRSVPSVMLAERSAEHGCPRCGYDLSGAAGAWEDACPVRGTCSECGLEFWWTDIVNADRLRVAGFVEHEEGGARRVFRSAWRTLGWMAWPREFWKRVGVEQPIRAWRWWVWALCVLGPLHAGAALASHLRMITSPGMFGRQAGAPDVWGQAWWVVSGWTYPVVTINAWSGPPRLVWLIDEWPLVVWMAAAAHALFWGMMLILPATRGVAGVRALHVHRAGVYGLAWIAALSGFRLLRNLWLAAETAWSGSALGGWRGARIWRIGDFPLELTGAVLIGWVCAWWLFAMRDGWRLPGWRVVWALLAFAALLGAAIVWQWLPEIRSGTWRYLVPGMRGP